MSTTNPVLLPKYSIGMGDRFAHQAKAQLRACVMAAENGVDVTPVWNKSNREHLIIGSEPSATRVAADAAVKALGWSKPYFLDADHINRDTVARFLAPCDFFTIDVAVLIGKAPAEGEVDLFLEAHPELTGDLRIAGIDRALPAGRAFVRSVAGKYLAAVDEAAQIYRHIAAAKGEGTFIPEISMDETDAPQTPVELLIILAAIAAAGIPIQTIAPKFTGRFNKGVDYQGDVAQFRQEFSDDIAVIAHAVERYGMQPNLKLSVHSGSDKFSIYEPMRTAMRQSGAGIHLKTAGTTWLEELIGLAEGGGAGTELAKEVYAEAYAHREELCAPYSTVIEIDPARLPTPAEVQNWSPAQFIAALRHDPDCPGYNSSMRQLLHVGFKVAAKMGQRYLSLLEEMESTVSKNVTLNLFERHIRPLFL